jgi:hypothetical protein
LCFENLDRHFLKIEIFLIYKNQGATVRLRERERGGGRMASANRLLYLEHQFGKKLREALIQRYKRLPSTAFVAIHFNRELEN